MKRAMLAIWAGWRSRDRERKLLLETEPCLERIQPLGEKPGSACLPVWNGMVGHWWCKHCGADVQITKEAKDAG